MNKQIYIELMDLVLTAYSKDKIESYTKEVEERGLWEHGFPRLTANLGILIAHGKRIEYKEMFRYMMDLCCIEIPTAHARNGHQVANDFSVKEIVFCLLEIEKAKVFDEEVTQGWRAQLSQIIPKDVYSDVAPTPPVRMGNFASFAAASEQLRSYAGIANEHGFIENQVISQLLSFDENGMYRDPKEPMLYDFAARLELAMVSYFGYDGESRDWLMENLMKSADITLQMQSVTGEIPFGGRSNQFPHNEATYAALCEFYAGLYKANGDLEKAGKFKDAARLAIDDVVSWLNEEKISHVKNRYDCESMYGCETYAYFDKYMVTVASCLYCAYIMADDTIEKVDCPAVNQNYICETSPYFHKIMCKYQDYFIEIETDANELYDANGLGRVHKRNAPAALALSVPFSKKPNYMIDIENPSCLSICAGIKTDNGYEYTCDTGTEYKLIEKYVGEDAVKVKFECKTPNAPALNKTIIVTEEGVEMHVETEGEILITFPMFFFDGKEYTQIEVAKDSASVTYRGYKCTYTTNGMLSDEKRTYANRNGHYKAFTTKNTNHVALKIAICKC